MGSAQRYLLDVDDIVKASFFTPDNANATLAGLSANASTTLSPNAGGLGNNNFIDGSTVIYNAAQNRFISAGEPGTPDNFDDRYYTQTILDGRFEGLTDGGKYKVDWGSITNKNATQTMFLTSPPRIFNRGDFPGNFGTGNYTAGRVALFDWTTFNVADYADLTGQTVVAVLLSYQISLNGPDDGFLRFLAARKDSSSPQVMVSVARSAGSGDDCGWGGIAILPSAGHFDLRLAAGGTATTPSATTLLGLGGTTQRAYLVIDVIGYLYR